MMLASQNAFDSVGEVAPALLCCLWTQSWDGVSQSLAAVQRVVLLSRNPQTGLISFRHYSIVAKPSGVSKGIKSIVGRRVPDLSRLHDVSELLTQGGYGSVCPCPPRLMPCNEPCTCGIHCLQ